MLQSGIPLPLLRSVGFLDHPEHVTGGLGISEGLPSWSGWLLLAWRPCLFLSDGFCERELTPRLEPTDLVLSTDVRLIDSSGTGQRPAVPEESIALSKLGGVCPFMSG